MRKFVSNFGRVVAMILSLSVLTAPMATAAESDFSKYWTIDDAFQDVLGEDEILFSYSENGSLRGTTPVISALDGKTNAYVSFCKQFGEDPCTLAQIKSKAVNFYSVVPMPFCSNSDDGDCLQSLTLVSPEGKAVEAEFVRAVDGVTYSANAEFSFPETSNQLLFRAPGLLHAGGTDTYAVEYAQTLEWVGSTTPIYRDLKVAVVPYVETESTDIKTQRLIPRTQGKGKYRFEPNNYRGGTIFGEDGLEGRIANFAEGVVAKVEIRANKKFGGWFRGRLTAPEFDAKVFSKTQQLITISGTSVEVPRLAGVVDAQQFKKHTDVPFSFFERNKGGGVGGDVSDPQGVFSWLEAIRAVSKDKAAGVHRAWIFATVPAVLDVGCYKTSGVQGVVATNAAVYGGGAPRFENGFLNYKVGGLHYLPNGKKAIGSYDLIMRSDIARCIYKFSKAPVSATISITGDGGSQVATTVVREKNGWLYLSAKGFTFSTKTIKVKLSQKKVTITCVSKSNPSRKTTVTGFAPICPKGFQKK
jgi:hypothetical protein